MGINRLRLILVWWFNMTALCSLAQWTGPTNPSAGQQFSYSFSNGTVYPWPNWTITNGEIISSYVSGSTYSATVQWTAPGSGSLTFKNRTITISTLSITVCSNPAIPGTSFSYSNQCHPNAVVITRNSSPPAGETWYWQSMEDGPTGTNTSLGSGASIQVSASVPVYYYLRAYSACGWSPSATITATIHAQLQSTTGASACSGSSMTLSAFGSGVFSYSWYDACSGGTLVYRGGGSYATPALTTSTYYWVAAHNPATGIDGPRSAVYASVLPLPGTMNPSVSQSTLCGNGTVNLSATGAGTNEIYRWYTTSSGGSPLGSTSQSISVTTTFYVAGYNTSSGCEGVRSPITITVYALPEPPGVSSATYCGSGTVTATPGANANNIRWYDSPSGGSLLTTNPTSPTTTTTTTYYITSYNTSTGCESTSRIAVPITINPIPAAPTASNTTLCGTGTMSAIPGANGNTVRWYSALTGGTLLATSTTSPSTSLTTTYYLSSYNSTTGCESTTARVTVTLTVNAVPAAPTATNTVLCGSGTMSASPGSNGNTVRWYNTLTGGTLMATSTTSPSTSSTTTYYISSYNSTTGCESTTARLPVTLTINPVPSAPTLPSGRCGPGTVVATIGANGNTVRWYNALTGGTLLATSTTSPNTTTTTTYYITSYNTATGCESSPRQAATVNINTIPANPGYSGHIRFGTGPLTLSGTGTPSGGSYKWYNSAGTYQSTALTYAVPSVSASVNNYMYLRAVSSAGCESGSVPINVVVYPIPVVSAPQNYVVKEIPVTLDAGAGYDSYTWRNSSNTVVGTIRTLTTAIPSTYTVTVTKTGATGVSNPFVLSGSQFTGMNKNYIVTNTAQIPGISDPNTIQNLSAEKVAQQVAYFDGLGRPSQTIATQASVSKTDLIAPVVYDAFGREAKKYLPVVTGNTGRYQEGLMDAAGNYLVNTYNNPSDKIADDTRPFSETVFEASPLNRPEKDYGAGLAWSPAAGGNDKPIQHAYRINKHGTGSNTTEEEIIAWNANGPGVPVRATVLSGYIALGGYYASGQLTIKSTKDESGNEVREYTDKLGRVVLKKVQATTAGASDLNDLTGTSPGWALTYYLYDDLGNLRYVFPPELSKILHTNADTYPISTINDLDPWAFQYKYDERKRMSEKKVPGAGWVYMVYDKRDRLVLTQDANQRSSSTKYWTFTKYDVLNRPILTGIYVNAGDRTTLQTAVNNHYTTNPYFETFSLTGAIHGYSNVSFPLVSNQHDYLSVTYYDNYDFRSLWYGNYTYLDENLSEVATYSSYTYHQPDVENLRVIGQVTGTKIKVLDGGVTGGYTWLKAITYYDDKYRVIQTLSDNYKGGTDRVTNVLDFVGKVLKSKSTHVESDVQWKNLVATVATGNKLARTTTGGIWNAGASSIQVLTASQSGYLEFIATETTTYRMIGFADSDPDAVYTSIDYAWYLLNDGTLNIYESGTSRGSFGTYKSGDNFKIERSGSTILYYQNNVLKYTSTIPSSTLLMVDASFHTTGTTLADVRTSFSTSSKTITRWYEYDHAGRLLRTWHKLDAQPEILLTLNEYNELGQLVDKKLHSTVSTGSNAKQSVDYRYNIRGWLTSMNDASLTNTTTTTKTNDDVGDFFGMNLEYNTNDLGLTNISDRLYNGNISAIAWSDHLAIDTIKQNGYAYTYDPLNRIKTSAFKEKNSTWATPANSALSETGFLYDLNGNITQLQRNDRRTSGWMDNLEYTYFGNQLIRVTDSDDDFAGFIDGQPGTGNDYTYDPNGNMTRDLNKGIGTSLVDGTNLITYNYLNLPETVTKGNNSIRYIYDAAGRKLAQVTTYGGQQKQVDYASEFQYENDQLQFISHEEGRIVLASNKTIYTHAGDALTNITAVTSTLAVITQNGQTYVRATANGTTSRQGMFPIGSTIPVAAGEQYRIRAKGYRFPTSNSVHLIIRVNGVDVNWPGASLPAGSQAESWIEQTITIPAGGTALQAGVIWNTTANSQQFFLNDFEITKLTTTSPEYQYNLKDHLGNVRLTFTTKDETETNTATLEPANANTERGQFLRYDHAKLVNTSLFDRTNGSAPTTTTGYAQRLNGLANEKYGLAKSLSVMPGDLINAEVYAKYVDPNTSNWTGVLATLMSQIAANTAGVVVDGANYTTSTTSFPAGFGTLQSKADNGAPRAYLNWLVFDRNYVFITGGFKQISTAARETGTDVAHERIFNASPITITLPGYVYIYLSNESTAPVEVFFDDFKVTHTKSPVIQQDDYYPFGLTFNSYSRENIVEERYLYNGKEEQDELDLGWLDFGRRMYQPDIGRFMVHDRFTEKFFMLSSYQFAANNPLSFIDLNGDSIISITRSGQNISILNSPVEEGGENFTNTITLESDVSMDDVSDYSAGIVNDAMVAIGDNSIEISSGTRTPEQQVEVMYYNLENGSSVAGEKDTYGTAGDKVIDTYVQAKSETKTEFIACDVQTTTHVNSPSQIKQKMLNTVNEQGPTNVSNHVGINRNSMNVFDIKPSTVSDPTKMHNALVGDSRVKQVWSPVNKKKEKAIHVEIKQLK